MAIPVDDEPIMAMSADEPIVATPVEEPVMAIPAAPAGEDRTRRKTPAPVVYASPAPQQSTPVSAAITAAPAAGDSASAGRPVSVLSQWARLSISSSAP